MARSALPCAVPSVQVSLAKNRSISEFSRLTEILIIREKGQLIPVEIKSSATFSPDFVKRLEWLHTLGIKRVLPGAILYNGEQTFNVRGVRVLNPLHVEDIWQTLTVPVA